jgi:hypothetical protein
MLTMSILGKLPILFTKNSQFFSAMIWLVCSLSSPLLIDALCFSASIYVCVSLPLPFPIWNIHFLGFLILLLSESSLGVESSQIKGAPPWYSWMIDLVEQVTPLCTFMKEIITSPTIGSDSINDISCE